MLQIYCKNNNSTREFPEGSSLLDIYNGFNLAMPYGPVSAKVNNKVESLDFRVYYNKDIEFLDITSSSGMRTYVRSLFFILVKAVEELYPQGSISLEHPISKGYFCKLHIDRTIGLDDVQRIKQKMQEIIAADIPYTRTESHTEEVVRLFEKRGMMDKARLLDTYGQLYSYYYQLGDTVDCYYSSLVPSTGYIRLFDIVKYYDGLLLRIPSRENPTKLEEVVKQAQNALGMYGRKTILFIDEIHRFNKGQQDYLLPFVEDGTIILIGATTENPYFEVNGALLSRSIVFELKALEIPEIKELILRAVNDKEKGMGSYGAVLDEDALEFLADMAGGDARSALNAIELGILTTPRSDDGKIHITLDVASECIQKRVVRYDKNGDNHYDIISAFIKSMRGSDPDAAVYYLAKMLYAGEDVKFIARRIMILASEDIGNADPQALVVATAAAQAVERVGMPESQIILSQAVAYMACAPKSNAAVNAIFAAMNSVKRTKTTVPVHLQDAHYGGHEKLGHGIGYKYAHDYPNHYVQQQYLPDEIKDEKFYELSDMGYEKKLKEHMEFIRRNKQ